MFALKEEEEKILSREISVTKVSDVVILFASFFERQNKNSKFRLDYSENSTKIKLIIFQFNAHSQSLTNMNNLNEVIKLTELMEMNK